MSDSYEPGVFVKGDHRRTATKRSVAVALVFEGYVREGDLPSVENVVDESGTDTGPAVPETVVPGKALVHVPIPRDPRTSTTTES